MPGRPKLPKRVHTRKGLRLALGRPRGRRGKGGQAAGREPEGQAAEWGRAWGAGGRAPSSRRGARFSLLSRQT